MSKDNESDQKTAQHATSLEERMDMLFEELSFAVHWQRSSILLIYYQSEQIRVTAERTLEKQLEEIGKKVVRIKVDARHFDIALLLSQHPERDQAIFFVSGLSHGGGEAGANAYRALNMRREYFIDYTMRVILWLSGDEVSELARHAPDFWAFRHHLVEIDDFSNGENFPVPVNELPKREEGFPGQLVGLDKQIGLYEAKKRALPKRSESPEARLELLSKLAALYQAKQAYAQAVKALKQAVIIAKPSNNALVLASLWGNLGSVYIDFEQFTKAVRAYRKAIRLNPQDVTFWIGLGRTYHIEKRFSDAIIAYRQAIRLDPQNPSAKSSLAACYRILEKDNLGAKRSERSQLGRPESEEARNSNKPEE